jgi:hypothetical protein
MATGPRHVLITQWQMCQFSGSEMVTLELAEHFAGRGARVTVVVHQHGGPIVEMLRAAGDVELWSSRDPGLDDHLRTDPPDLAWIHHQIVPDVLLSGELDVPTVFNHMSPYQPLEQVLVPDVERSLATVSVFNSPECFEAQRDSGVLDGFDADRLRVFANPAPDAMAGVVPRERGDGPLRLLVVSNHLPDELVKALAALPPHVEVARIGAQRDRGAVPRRVDPELLSGHDAVLSIGKSVQYALVAGLPVYCYDRFGGPGWLDPDNVATARHHNFSGRGFGRKAPEDIARELVDGFERATADAGVLRAEQVEGLLLGPALDELWALCLARPRPARAIDGTARAAHRSVTALGREWAILQARSRKAAAAAAAVPGLREELARATAGTVAAEEVAVRDRQKIRKLRRRAQKAEAQVRRLEDLRGRRLVRGAERLVHVVDRAAGRPRRERGAEDG